MRPDALDARSGTGRRESRPGHLHAGARVGRSPDAAGTCASVRSRARPARPGGRAALSDVAKLLRLGEALQLLQRLVLDLADPLARDVERAPDLVEGARVLAAEAVAQLEHAAFAIGEVLERLAQGLLGEDLGGALVRRLRALIGDELPELGLLLIADWLLERHRRLRGALDRVDLLGIYARDLRDLVRGWLAPELCDELALRAPDLVELLDDVHGNTDRARLVGERARDRLANPPRRVGRELEPLAVVELLRRAHEPERALLDQVEERETLVAIVLRDRHHEPQVRLDHLLLRVQVAALDPLREIDLLLGGQEADLADVLEEQLQRVRRHVRLEVELRFRFAPPTLVGGALELRRRCRRRVDVLYELDLGALEEA